MKIKFGSFFILLMLALVAWPSPLLAQAPTDTVTAAAETPTGTAVPPTVTATAAATNTPVATLPAVAATSTTTLPTLADTPPPTATSTATATPCPNPGEPNDTPGSGPILLLEQPLPGLLLTPLGDVDFFLMWAKSGRAYQVTTAAGQGVDTRLRVFDPAGVLLTENDDYIAGSSASRVAFVAGSEGWFSLAVDSPTPLDWGCRSYSLLAVELPPTPTPTPTATTTPTVTPTPSPTPTLLPTPPPGTATPAPTALPAEWQPDACEPNYDPATATGVGLGQTLNLNFNPWPPGSNNTDNDFFKFSVKAGDRVRVETLNLAPGLDTNIILYRDNGQVIAGNDDCRPGERRSCLEWPADTTGLVYLLVGPVGLVPDPVTAGAAAYSLALTNLNLATPTAALPAGGSTGEAGYGLPRPVTPAVSLGGDATNSTSLPSVQNAATATPVPVFQVRAFSLAPPTPTPRPLQSINLALAAYYDENNNNGSDTGEGVAGLEVRVLDSVTNQLLGQTFTDSLGHAELTVAAAGEVRLSVPYLSYNQAVKPPGKALTIRLAPLRLPSLIP